MKLATFAVFAVGLAACGGQPPVCTANQPTACSCSDGSLSTQTCNAQGTGFTACMCPIDPCAADQTYISGACCPNSCVTTSRGCCNTGDVCVTDNGTSSCFTQCDHNSECPGSSPTTRGGGCCKQLYSTTNVALSYGVCDLNATATTECRCANDSDCNETSYGCAPAVNSTGNPMLPYTCHAAGCGVYTPCACNNPFGLESCPSGYTNACEFLNNTCFCGRICSNDTMCGSAHCQQLYNCCGLGPAVCAP